MEPKPDLTIGSLRSLPFEREAIVGLALDLRRAALTDIEQALKEAVEAREDRAFTNLIVAALIAGHPVDAGHLEKGTIFFPDTRTLTAVAGKCSGDVPGALVAALRAGNMGHERTIDALLAAGAWCSREEIPAPAGLVSLARTLARRTRDNRPIQMGLLALSELIRDPHLAKVLEDIDDPRSLRMGSMMGGVILELIERPISACFRRESERVDPIQHASPEPGRNDPCPCGSGRKYKKCCIGKAQVCVENRAAPRRDPSAVRAVVEEEVTAERLKEMRSYELLKLDPAKLAPELVGILLSRLTIYHEHEAAVRVLERVGLRKDLEGWWDDVLLEASEAWRKDLAERLLGIPGAPARREDLPFAARLLLSPPESMGALGLLEEQAMRSIDPSAPVSLVDIAHTLLEGPWPSLGILLARGVLPSASPLDQWALLETLLETRDRLGLSPEDPVEEVLDRLSIEDSRKEARDSSTLAEARNGLAEKSEESRKLREEIAALQARLAAAPASAAPGGGAAGGAGDRASAELRKRLESLEDELKERHGERNRLRKELREALDRIEALRRERPAGRPEHPDEDREEEGLLAAEEDHGPQPVRVPVFPARFHEALAGSPPLVARTALTLIGRLAAGEPAAFRGARRLEGRREVFRHRVGILHRLLFRLGKETLEILALIPRRDLDRAIRSLPKG